MSIISLALPYQHRMISTHMNLLIKTTYCIAGNALYRRLALFKNN